MSPTENAWDDDQACKLVAVSHPPVGPPTVKVVVAMAELTIIAAAARHNSILAIDIADQKAALTMKL